MLTRNHHYALLSVTTCILMSGQVFGSPTKVVHVDTPQCDPLFIPDNVDEIGDYLEFPADEALWHNYPSNSPLPACPASDISGVADPLVEIRNMTGKAWTEVWYVADDETTLTNFDGAAHQAGYPHLQESFRIDAVGLNQPLVSESFSNNGIWDIGETWVFILQDYTNLLNLPPDAITSIGVGSASVSPASGVIDSSGSIIAVPEPASAVLLAPMSLLAITRRRMNH